MKRPKILLLLTTAVALSAGDTSAQGLFQKAIGAVAKYSGKIAGQGMLFGTTDKLTGYAPAVVYRQNVYPKKVGVLETDVFGKGWLDGGDQIFISLMKRRGVKMSNLKDGSVTVDGQPATFQDLGIYTFATAHSNAPHTVEITAANGEKSRFTINPMADQVKIVSINGQTGDNVSVDLTKDLVLELSNPGPADGAVIQVTFTASKIGLNTFYEVGNFKPTSKLVIPAEALANAGLPSGTSYSLKNCYLQVARLKWDKATAISGVYKDMPFVASVSDGRFLNVTAKPEFSEGFTAKGVYKGGDKKMEYNFTKEEADLSRPFSQMKRIGVGAIGVRGVSTAETRDKGALGGFGGDGSYTDHWASFSPSNAWMDGISASMEREVSAILKDLFGTQTVSAEAIGATKAYSESNFMAETDDGTKTSYARGYKTGKIMSPAAMVISFRPISEGKTITEEAGVDGLFRCVLDLSLKMTKQGVTTLSPTLSFTVYGKPGGVNSNPTTYVSGTIESKDLSISKKTSEAELTERLALPDMMAALRQALTELRDAEKQNGAHDRIWSMQ